MLLVAEERRCGVTFLRAFLRDDMLEAADEERWGGDWGDLGGKEVEEKVEEMAEGGRLEELVFLLMRWSSTSAVTTDGFAGCMRSEGEGGTE
jgi:hypothetical protein